MAEQPLYNTCVEYKADGVLGPVLPHFEVPPPDWVLRGRFCERPTYRTCGTVIHWRNSRTGNVLLKRRLLQERVPALDPGFRIQGEDVHFFKQMARRGAIFVWCNEAAVHEVVTANRCRKSYFLRRAFVQGNASLRYDDRLRPARCLYVFAKSAVAVVLYTTILPFCRLLGTHVFIRYLIKDVHHLSRLMALFGLRPVARRGL